ncbi:hypothetical protein [Streptomyces sp. SPB4]|uniref:hypothetical protein n=1 Tax=Streptomyces sp. SPB4 TaxID=2940553 RepID=UPI002476C4C9|nr:hypothetical protein [Streptomyces sp. SPB4]MDH6544838.1 hypothetical protein [Streptomyces sp. SPB4]
MPDRVARQAPVPGSGGLPPQDVATLRPATLERLVAGGHCSSLTSTIGEAVVIQVEQGPFDEYVARAKSICGDPLRVRRTAGGQGMTTSLGGTKVTGIDARTCRSAYPGIHREQPVRARSHVLAASGIQAATDQGVAA